MWGFAGVAGHRVLSAGTVLIVGSGLALYQMTSLVLGPGGSRQLHLSLTVPGADLEERSESWSSGRRLALGTLAGPSRSASARAASVSQGASAPPAARPAAAPVAPVPVTPQLPTAHPSAPPVATIVVRPTPLPVVPSGHDAD